MRQNAIEKPTNPKINKDYLTGDTLHVFCFSLINSELLRTANNLSFVYIAALGEA